MSPVRVLIVADDPLARAGLATLLADVPDLFIAGRISGAEDLAAALETHRPDAVLWDTGWKPETALAQMAEAPKSAPIIALVGDEAVAIQAWAAGAQGLLSRAAPPERISAALAAGARDLSVVDADYRGAIAGHEAPPPALPRFPGEESPLVEELTPRELEVLRLLAEGLPNKTIAQRLDISEHTVKFHVNALLGKLGVGSRTEAVVRATRLGLIFL
ncbi:MAG: LuxR C-terminal-related transcriptional regulator [Nitrososphaerales archaeon]